MTVWLDPHQSMSRDTALKRWSNAAEQIGTGLGIMRRSAGKHEKARECATKREKMRQSAKKHKSAKKCKKVKKHRNAKKHENVRLRSHTRAVHINVHEVLAFREHTSKMSSSSCQQVVLQYKGRRNLNLCWNCSSQYTNLSLLPTLACQSNGCS